MCIVLLVIITHHYFSHSRTKLRSGAVGRFSDNSSFIVDWYVKPQNNRNKSLVSICVVDKKLYNELLENWFPTNGKPPSAFLLDTSEEALLLPDLLKLRMIRSNSEQLISAGRSVSIIRECALLTRTTFDTQNHFFSFV